MELCKLGCVIISIFLSSLVAPATASPKLVCEEPTYSFGSVRGTQTVQHTFTLRNAGTDRLEIVDVRADCGCTVIEIDSRSLSSGESASIKAKLVPNATKSGHVKKTIVVTSNDPDNPKLVLAMEGKVEEVISVSPGAINFGRIPSDGGVSRSIDIVAKEPGLTFQITGAIVEQGPFSAEVQPVTQGKEFKIIVRPKQIDKEGEVAGRLRITTDLAELPEVNVPLSAEVKGKFIISDSEIKLVKGRVETITIFLEPGIVKDFGIKAIEQPNENIEVDVTPLGRSRFRIRFMRLLGSEDLNGKVFKILTDTDAEPIIIPIRVVEPK